MLAFGAPGILTFENTIIADAKSTNPMESTVNCQTTGGTITSLDFNLADDTSCNLVAPADRPNLDPGLAPLAANGAGTPTHAIDKSSPATDRGDLGLLTGNIDQRGLSRPADFADVANAAGGDGSDIGAFELQLPPVTPVVPVTPVTPGTPAAPVKKKCKKGRKLKKGKCVKKKRTRK